MAAFRTLGIAFMMFAITFPYLGGWIFNVGLAGVVAGGGNPFAGGTELATLEVRRISNWDAGLPEAEQSRTELEIVGVSTISTNSFSASVASEGVTNMLTPDGVTALNERTEYAGRLGLPIISTQRTANNLNYKSSLEGYPAQIQSTERTIHQLEQQENVPTGGPNSADKEQILTDLSDFKELQETYANNLYQAKTSSRLAVIALSWGMLAALAVVTIETFAYLNWIKLGNVWRVPILAFLALTLFLLSSLIFVGVEDAMRQQVNDQYCVQPERFVSQGDHFLELFRGETSDRCQVSFKPSVAHVTVFMAFSAATLSFIFFAIAKAKQEWTVESKDSTTA